jgi:hypothetical protein
LTLAEAVTVFIRALGLETMAPKFGAVTTFRDNDDIPAYAKNAVRVAEQIGLVRGDEKGYLNPNSKLTNARAAALLNRFIDYMRDGIRKVTIEINIWDFNLVRLISLALLYT